jgi:hypothetical protein
MTRVELARWWRELLSRSDALHPAALVVLVAVLLSLSYGAVLAVEPALVAFVIALVAVAKAAACIAAAVLVGRRAVHIVTRYFARRATSRGYSA